VLEKMACREALVKGEHNVNESKGFAYYLIGEGKLP
jgi:hypothetical protein